MLRVALLAGSAAGAVLAARRSRASRDAEARPREHDFAAAEAAPDAGGVAWQPLHAPAAAQVDLAAANAHAPGGRPGRGAELLLYQAAASVLLIALAPLLRPSSMSEVVWMQLVALTCLVALAIPLAANLHHRAAARQLAAGAAAAAAPPPAAGAAGSGIDALNGVWLKDKEASDSLEPALDTVKIRGLLRMAIGLIKGVEITAAPGRQFRFAVLSGIGWFKITESYPLGGAAGAPPVRHRRRDLRGGTSSPRWPRFEKTNTHSVPGHRRCSVTLVHASLECH